MAEDHVHRRDWLEFLHSQFLVRDDFLKLGEHDNKVMRGDTEIHKTPSFMKLLTDKVNNKKKEAQHKAKMMKKKGSPIEDLEKESRNK